MKELFAILSGKLAGYISQLLGREGSTIPGVVARKIAPQLLKKLSEQVPYIILITGTNGKTTTTNLLSQILKYTEKRVLCNYEGANMITGVTACFVKQASFRGQLPYDYAVLEVDEGSLPEVLEEVAPKAIIFTNFFRDQLDRYEEIDILINHIKSALQNKKIKLFLNADDPFVVQLAEHGDAEPIYFGIRKGSDVFDNYTMGESKYCPLCGEKLQYEDIHYGQLGIYHCSCEFHRPPPKYEAHEISSGIGLNFKLDNEKYRINLNGIYNIYNALAATTCAKELGFNHEEITSGLLVFKTQNGRMQQFFINGSEWILNLVKNPAGFNLSLSEAQRVIEDKQMIFLLNDLDADGNDISWIWDVDFERVNRSDFTRYICSGRRAHDLALRLKYAGVEVQKILVKNSVSDAIQEAYHKPIKTFLFPTYTLLQSTKRLLETMKGD